jgi:uncharacterized protein (DUF2141 family)
MKTLLTLAYLLLGVQVLMAQHILKVKIDNVKPRKGKVFAALCNDSQSFLEKSFRQAAVEVPPSGEVLIPPISPKGLMPYASFRT